MSRIVVSYQSSPDFARLAARRYVRRSSGAFLLGAVVILAICVTRMVTRHSEWYDVVLTVVSLGYLLRHVASYMQCDRAFASLSDPRVVIRISDDAIEFETAGHTSTLDWDRITRLWRFDDVWLLFTYLGAHYVAVPTEILSDDAREIIERGITRSGGAVD